MNEYTDDNQLVVPACDAAGHWHLQRLNASCVISVRREKNVNGVEELNGFLASLMSRILISFS